MVMVYYRRQISRNVLYKIKTYRAGHSRLLVRALLSYSIPPRGRHDSPTYSMKGIL